MIFFHTAETARSPIFLIRLWLFLLVNADSRDWVFRHSPLQLLQARFVKTLPRDWLSQILRVFFFLLLFTTFFFICKLRQARLNDFQNHLTKWKISCWGLKKLCTLPCVCMCTYAEENGSVGRVNLSCSNTACLRGKGVLLLMLGQHR